VCFCGGRWFVKTVSGCWPVKEEKKRKKRKVSAFQEAIKLGEEAAEAAAERPSS